MTTSEKLPKKNLKQMELNLQTSSQEASRVNRLVSRANKKEQVTTDISGQRCFASSKHSNRGSLLARMCEELLTSKTAWSSRLCALTWKAKDTKFNRLLFQLQGSVLRTEEKESGSLPSEKMWPTPRTGGGSRPNQKGGKVLNEEVLIAEGLRERGKTLDQMWPTPQKADHLANQSETLEAWEKRAVEKKKEGINLQFALRHAVQKNPTMWPTPTNQEAGKGKFLETLTTKEGEPAKQGERAYNPKTGKHVQVTLDRAAQMWPTPTVGCVEGGEQSNRVERTAKGAYILRKKNKPENTFGAKLSDAVLFEEKQKMWPTPSRGMWKQDVNDNGEYAQRVKDKGSSNNVASSGETKRTEKKLADTDSERLEGFRQSSRQFNEKSFTPSSSEERQGNLDQGWWSVEPNVGRVAHGVSGRVHRLKGLGNSIVPQIAEEIGRAIIRAVKD